MGWGWSYGAVWLTKLFQFGIGQVMANERRLGAAWLHVASGSPYQDEDRGVCHQHGLHGYKHVIVWCQCQERQRVAYCHPPGVPRSRHEQVHQPPEAEESRAV